MPQYTMVVLTNPVEGRDDEFNAWYTDVHLDDVLALGPFVAAQRFRFVGTDPPYRYMALYQVEADDVTTASEVLRAAAGTDALPMSDALDRSRLARWYVEPITELRRAARSER